MLNFEVHYDAHEHGEMHPHNMFQPVPAINILPDWFKRLDSFSEEHGHAATAKQCRGVWDMMTAGYMLLWPFDCDVIKNEDGKLDILKSRSQSNENFSPHPHFQLDGYPDLNLHNQAQGVQKLKTPYKVKTPPGTSILVIQPQYRPELKTEVSNGIIDTDKYYGQFNILFTLKETNSNKVRKIKAGTPLAQIIPFVREEWNMTFNVEDKERAIVVDAMSNDIDNFYNRYMWERKVYKEQ